MSVLELKNIRKSYFLGKEEFPVLKGIDLTFERGDFVSLLGESGGGKSTLMNIIGGLDREYQGDVIVDGVAQKSKKEKDMDKYRRDTIGFIFQSFNLVNYLSVVDNVLLSLKMTSLTDKERLERAEDLLKQVGLFEHRHKKPSQLSGGQKQRVAIARALASDPEIILADEPTGALDSQNTKEVLAILRKIAESGKTVIVVTHSQEVADYGTRIIRLADGVITGDERLKLAYPVPDVVKPFSSKPQSANSTFKMAFKHFMNNWKQNLLIMMGTAIGLFSVMFFLGLGNGATRYMNKMVTDLANPNVPMVLKRRPQDEKKSNEEAMAATQRAMAQGDTSLLLQDADVDKLKDLSHVDKVEPVIDVAGALSVSTGNRTTVTTNLSTWTNIFTTKSIQYGTKKAPKAGQVVLSQKTAKELYLGELKDLVGKTISYKFTYNGKEVTKDFVVSGILKKQAAFGDSANFSDVKAALGDSLLGYSNIILNVDEVTNVQPVLDKVAKMTVDGKKAYATFSVGSVLKPITDITTIVSGVLAAIAGISLLVSIFMIVVTTYMSVAERTKEIGIIRAMGGRRKDISRMFTYESLILGLFSAALGIIVAFIGQVVINKSFYDFVKGDIVSITSGYVIFAIIIAVLIALIASLAPSGKAARLNTIEALAAD
jgi:ABC-type lipoprotein export system ATPase subunit/ABC-type antimicrobial peptide transport system permease subunit